MKKIIQVAIACTLMFSACKKTETNQAGPAKPVTSNGLQRSTNGSAGIEMIYYDSMLFKMNSYQLSDKAAASQIAHNKSINILYEAEGFLTVTDAIQGDGYNPIWREVDIIFNTGTPHQFYTDDAILDAAAGTNPEITLVTTDEVYRCAILQQNK